MIDTMTIRRFAAMSVTLSALVAAQAAFAGECPAGKEGKDLMKAGAAAPHGVTDKVIAAIDLSSKGGAFKGQMLRMRRLVVQPGGVVPWHSHEARPANIYVIDGGITEYRSTCAVPIEHKAGDVTAEFGNLAHWWKNNTRKPTVLISADILPPQMSEDHSM